MPGLIRFGVTCGLRGFFAVMYDDEGPIQTGIGSHADGLGAAEDAIEWAEAENYTAEAERLRKKYNL